MPPGILTHIVSQSEAGLAITDVWEDGTNAQAFYDGVAAAGFQVSQLVFSKVYEYIA